MSLTPEGALLSPSHSCPYQSLSLSLFPTKKQSNQSALPRRLSPSEIGPRYYVRGDLIDDGQEWKKRSRQFVAGEEEQGDEENQDNEGEKKVDANFDDDGRVAVK
jgi:hypothetical protein